MTYFLSIHIQVAAYMRPGFLPDDGSSRFRCIWTHWQLDLWLHPRQVFLFVFKKLSKCHFGYASCLFKKHQLVMLIWSTPKSSTLCRVIIYTTHMSLSFRSSIWKKSEWNEYYLVWAEDQLSSSTYLSKVYSPWGQPSLQISPPGSLVG